MTEPHISRNEAYALVCLARYVVCADGKITDPELRALAQLGRHIGLDVFSDALDTTDTRTLDRTELVQLAAFIRVQEKRGWMHDRLVELARSDGLAAPEETLLADLATLWELDWAA